MERLRHDMKNHVLSIYGLWKGSEWDKLGDYLEVMIEDGNIGSNDDVTGSKAIDALLAESSKDKVEISEDGKVLLKENADGDDNTVTAETKADFTDIAKEPVAYTQTGEVINLAEQKTNISVYL